MELTPLLLDDAAIDRLKRHLALRLPEMKPSHRVEFVARALGYRTYGSLLADLKEGPVLIEHAEPECAADFAERVGYAADPNELRETMFGIFDLGHPIPVIEPRHHRSKPASDP